MTKVFLKKVTLLKLELSNDNCPPVFVLDICQRFNILCRYKCAFQQNAAHQNDDVTLIAAKFL
jgi:hypothetical protein